MGASDPGLMKTLMKQALQEVLEGEMTELLGAGPEELPRTAKATVPATTVAA